MTMQNDEFWRDAAADAYTNLTRVTRVYPKAKMLAVVDDLCLHGSVTQSELCDRHGIQDFISTSVGHVTVAVHGKGKVPEEGGWYRKLGRTYHVHPAFVLAWNRRRGPRQQIGAAAAAD